MGSFGFPWLYVTLVIAPCEKEWSERVVKLFHRKTSDLRLYNFKRSSDL